MANPTLPPASCGALPQEWSEHHGATRRGAFPRGTRILRDPMHEPGEIAIDGTLTGPGRVDAGFGVHFPHRVRFTHDLLDPANPTLADALDPFGTGRGQSRVLLAIDDGVDRAWPDLAERFAAYARSHAARVPAAAACVRVPGGEAAKRDAATVEALYGHLADAGICRQSFVIAIGGGAMLDATGFAAATAHRGVRLVRVPTTTLAQDDAAMGVKNGINWRGRKNFTGAFAPPWAVLCDENFLRTLPDDEWRCGFSEAVKIALLRDPAFFARLEADADAIRAREPHASSHAIRRSAELHLRHVTRGGDPFELLAARPLDYGHWAAHRLEEITDFALGHGAAVGVGVALDTVYAALEGRLPRTVARRTLDLLARLGIPTAHPALLDTAALLAGIDSFREHLGGRLTVTLLRDVGVAEDVHALDPALVTRSVEVLRAGAAL